MYSKNDFLDLDLKKGKHMRFFWGGGRNVIKCLSTFWDFVYSIFDSEFSNYLINSILQTEMYVYPSRRTSVDKEKLNCLVFYFPGNMKGPCTSFNS